MLWAEVLVWQGHCAEAERVLASEQVRILKDREFLADGLEAFIALLRGDFEGARQGYALAYRQGKRNASTRTLWFTALPSLGYPLALLQVFWSCQKE